jgi:cell division protein FtsB
LIHTRNLIERGTEMPKRKKEQSEDLEAVVATQKKTIANLEKERDTLKAEIKRTKDQSVKSISEYQKRYMGLLDHVRQFDAGVAEDFLRMSSAPSAVRTDA